jgi:prepilin-type N-terminal cleavage/methylation domain-containing protein
MYGLSYIRDVKRKLPAKEYNQMKRGFSLIELLVVVASVAILVGGGTP